MPNVPLYAPKEDARTPGLPEMQIHAPDMTSEAKGLAKVGEGLLASSKPFFKRAAEIQAQEDTNAVSVIAGKMQTDYEKAHDEFSRSLEQGPIVDEETGEISNTYHDDQLQAFRGKSAEIRAKYLGPQTNERVKVLAEKHANTLDQHYSLQAAKSINKTLFSLSEQNLKRKEEEIIKYAAVGGIDKSLEMLETLYEGNTYFNEAYKEAGLKKAQAAAAEFYLTSGLKDPATASLVLREWTADKKKFTDVMAPDQIVKVEGAMRTFGADSQADALSFSLYKEYGVFKDGKVDQTAAAKLYSDMSDPEWRMKRGVDSHVVELSQKKLAENKDRIENDEKKLVRVRDDGEIAEVRQLVAQKRFGEANRLVAAYSAEDGRSDYYYHSLGMVRTQIKSELYQDESRAFTAEQRALVKEEKERVKNVRLKGMQVVESMHNGHDFTPMQLLKFTNQIGGTHADYDSLVRTRKEIFEDRAGRNNYMQMGIDTITRFLELPPKEKRTPEQDLKLSQYVATLEHARLSANEGKGIPVWDPAVNDLVKQLLDKDPRTVRQVFGIDIPFTGDTRLDAETKRAAEGKRRTFAPDVKRTPTTGR